MAENASEIEKYGSRPQLESIFGPLEDWPFADRIAPKSTFRGTVVSEGVSEAEAEVLMGSYNPDQKGSAKHDETINPFDIIQGFFVDQSQRETLY